jgi:hypothetical protein
MGWLCRICGHRYWDVGIIEAIVERVILDLMVAMPPMRQPCYHDCLNSMPTVRG